MDAKAIGLLVFYGVSLPLAGFLFRHHYACRLNGREEHWFLSALTHVLPALMLVAPFILYAQEEVAALCMGLLVLAAVGLRLWAGFTFLTNGSPRPFRYRADRRSDALIQAELPKSAKEERERGESITPPRL